MGSDSLPIALFISLVCVRTFDDNCVCKNHKTNHNVFELLLLLLFIDISTITDISARISYLTHT